MIRLLLVNDEPLVCQGLHMWLKQVPDVTVVGDAYTNAEALQLAHELSPDVVLVDLSLPPLEEIAAVTDLRTAVPRTAVILLSLHDDAPSRAEACAAGAYALVGKQEGVQALLTAILAAGVTGS